MNAQTRRLLLLAGALVVIVGAIVYLQIPDPNALPPDAPDDIPASELAFPAAPDLRGATAWIGTNPLNLTELRGKVVLVDFWTYSCINCIHTFPHLQAMWERYRDDGLVIVGVHTPEFRFERDAANVAAAASRHNLTYPIAVDNSYSIWNAYENRYWPAEYLIDHWGRIRDVHVGEGAYNDTEAFVRLLLTDAGHEPNATAAETRVSEPGGLDLSPELYAAGGAGRVAIGNPEGYREGEVVDYKLPSSLPRDRIYLDGRFVGQSESVDAIGDARVVVPFRAGGANVVADGPKGACVEVLLDGAPLTRAVAARDVTFENGKSCLVLDGPRSYDFFAGSVGDHVVSLNVPSGFALYTFDFSATGEKPKP